jgi:hypothetical protein
MCFEQFFFTDKFPAPIGLLFSTNNLNQEAHALLICAILTKI